MNLRTNAKTVMVHTDGSCLHTGAGGWAAVVRHNGLIMEVSGHEKPTTNNRMELMGAIKALEVIDPGSYVHLFTDSRYVERGIVYWIRGWIARGWKSREGEPVKNQDLWEKLLEVSNRHFVVWQWVKGHDGDKWNERCDVLATTAAHKCN